MGFAEGVVWSLLGAVAHTVIDVLRKFGAQRLPPAGGVSLLRAVLQSQVDLQARHVDNCHAVLQAFFAKQQLGPDCCMSGLLVVQATQTALSTGAVYACPLLAALLQTSSPCLPSTMQRLQSWGCGSLMGHFQSWQKCPTHTYSSRQWCSQRARASQLPFCTSVPCRLHPCH